MKSRIRRKKRERKVKVCPNCGSLSIEYKIDSHRTGQKFFCKDCRFESSVILEVDDKLRKEIWKGRK